jgi:hypothetical protein
MMTEHKIGEVFLDIENFNQQKRLKCVDKDKETQCKPCVYWRTGIHISESRCLNYSQCCYNYQRKDSENVVFIETTEPLTTE